MNWAVKLGIIAVVLVAMTVLSYAAVSDDIFFIVQQLKPEDFVHDEEDGYTLPFFKDGTAVEAATLYYDISKGSGNLAPITFQILHKYNSTVDSLRVKFKMLQLPSALTLENPEGYPPLPAAYTTTSDNSSITFDFPDLGSQGSGTIKLYFWLNLSEIDPLNSDPLILETTFSMHEESIFKIVKYKAKIAVQLDIQSLVP